MSPTVSEQILRYLHNHSSRDIFVPTTKLAELFPTNSRTSINYYLKKLEADGKIRRYKYTSPAGSTLWYVPSSRVGKTLVFDIHGQEVPWSEIISRVNVAKDKNKDYKDLGSLMDYIADVSKGKDRERMHEDLEYAREQLKLLSHTLNYRKGMVDALLNDPILRDVDTLSELELEKTNAQTQATT